MANAAAIQGTRVGTPLYLSPELIKQQPYDYKIDMWATGCVLYHLACLEPPFTGENLIVLGNSIVSRHPKPLPSVYSARLQKLVERLLAKKPSERPSAHDMLRLLPSHFQKDLPPPEGATSHEDVLDCATASTAEGLSQKPHIPRPPPRPSTAKEHLVRVLNPDKRQKLFPAPAPTLRYEGNSGAAPGARGHVDAGSNMPIIPAVGAEYNRVVLPPTICSGPQFPPPPKSVEQQQRVERKDAHVRQGSERLLPIPRPATQNNSPFIEAVGGLQQPYLRDRESHPRPCATHSRPEKDAAERPETGREGSLEVHLRLKQDPHTNDSKLKLRDSKQDREREWDSVRNREQERNKERIKSQANDSIHSPSSVLLTQQNADKQVPVLVWQEKGNERSSEDIQTHDKPANECSRKREQAQEREWRSIATNEEGKDNPRTEMGSGAASQRQVAQCSFVIRRLVRPTVGLNNCQRPETAAQKMRPTLSLLRNLTTAKDSDADSQVEILRQAYVRPISAGVTNPRGLRQVSRSGQESVPERPRESEVESEEEAVQLAEAADFRDQRKKVGGNYRPHSAMPYGKQQVAGGVPYDPKF